MDIFPIAVIMPTTFNIPRLQSFFFFIFPLFLSQGNLLDVDDNNDDDEHSEGEMENKNERKTY